MAPTMQQGDLFERDEIDSGKAVAIAINDRCRVQTSNGYRVVTVCGLTLAHYAVEDRMGEAHAMVSLVDQWWAKQYEVATAFGCDVRTVRRNQSRFGSGGLAALGRKAGYPKGAPRLSASRTKLVSKWRAEGVPIRTMARRLGVNDKAVRKQLRRLGWSPEQAEQLSLDLKPAAADPNLSGPPQGQCSVDPEIPAGAAEDPLQAATESADPNLSGSETSGCAPMPVSLDADPTNRSVDRVLACLGMLDDAAPFFADTVRLPGRS